MKPLSKANVGSDYVISWLMGLPEILNYFKKSNISEGSVLHVICNYADAVLFSCGGKRFVLGTEAASHIQVTPCC